MDPLSSADLSTGGLSQMSLSLIKADIMTKSKSFDDVQKLSEKNKNSNKDKRRHSGSDKNVNIDNNENEYEYNNDNENENDTIENPMNRNILKNEINLNTNNNNNNSFDDIDVQLTKRLSNADLEPYKKQNNLITSENKNNLNILKSLSTLRPFKNFQKYNLFPQKSTCDTDLTSKVKKENISLSQQLSDKISNRIKNNDENDDNENENESLNDRESSRERGRERGRGSRDRDRGRDGENEGDRDEDDVDDDEDEDEEQFSENLDDMSLERVSDDRGGRSNDESEDLTAFDNENYNNNENDDNGNNDNDNSDNNSPIYTDRNTENDADMINLKSVSTESVKSLILSQKNLNNISTGDIILSKFDKTSDLNLNNEEGSIDQCKQNYQNEKFHENDGNVITDFENIYTENNDNLGDNDENKTKEISQKTVDEIRKLSNDGFSNKNVLVENVTEKDFYVIGDVSDVSNQVEDVKSTTHTQSVYDTEISIKNEKNIGVENDSKNTDLNFRENNKSNLTDLNIPDDIKVSRTYSIEDRTVPTAQPLAITKSRSTSSLRFQGEGTGTLKGIYAQGNQNVVLNATSKYLHLHFLL